MCIGVSFNKVAGLQVWRPVIKKRLSHMCFPVNIAKLLRRTILKNFCEWLLLDFCSLLLFEISRNSSECKNVYIKTLIFYHISNHTFLQYFLDIYKSFVEIQVQQVLPFFRKPFFSFFWIIWLKTWRLKLNVNFRIKWFVAVTKASNSNKRENKNNK